MKKRLMILGATTLVLAIVLATTIAGISVAVDGYTNAQGVLVVGGYEQGIDYYAETDMSVSPGSACVGELVTLSGCGARPYSQISVEMYWDGLYTTDSVLAAPLGNDNISVPPYESIVGVTQADGSGCWSMTMPAPQITFSPSDNTQLTMTGDRWTLVGTTSYFDTDLQAYAIDHTTYGTLVVLDCVAGEVAVSGAVSGGLPATGAPVAAMGLLGTGLLATAGLSLTAFRNRKR